MEKVVILSFLMLWALGQSEKKSSRQLFFPSYSGYNYMYHPQLHSSSTSGNRVTSPFFAILPTLNSNSNNNYSPYQWINANLQPHQHQLQQQQHQSKIQQQHQPLTTLTHGVLTPSHSFSQQHYNNYWAPAQSSVSTIPSENANANSISNANLNAGHSQIFFVPIQNLGGGGVNANLFPPSSYIQSTDINNNNNNVQNKPPQPDKNFQRQSIESYPSSLFSSHLNTSPLLSWPYSFINNPGFVRGHIEQRPDQNPKTSPQQLHHFNNANIQRNKVPGNVPFNRGAVEQKPGNHESEPREQPLSYQGDPGYNVVCYVSSWAFKRMGRGKFQGNFIDPFLCTHVIYAYATYDSFSQTLKEGDYATDIDRDVYGQVVGLRAVNPSLKILLAMGGWSDSGDGKYSKLAHSPDLRRKFARESVNFLKKYKFDGLSIDWSYPACPQSDCAAGPESDKMAFSSLLRDIKYEFEREGFLLAATLSGYKEVIELAYEVKTISQYLDLMNILSYDYRGAWEDYTGHASPLYQGPQTTDLYPNYNANYTMEYYASLGADRSKLNLGIPFYGQSFTLSHPGSSDVGAETNGPGEAGEYTEQPGMLAYFEICERIKNKGWKMMLDFKGSSGPYAYSRNQWVSFDDMEFLKRKARYVKHRNFGGVIVSTVDLDDFNGDCNAGKQPLLRAVAKELLPDRPQSFPSTTTSENPSSWTSTTSTTDYPPWTSSSSTSYPSWTTMPTTTSRLPWNPPSTTQGWNPPSTTQGWQPPSTTQGWQSSTHGWESTTEQGDWTSSTNTPIVWWPTTTQTTHLPCHEHEHTSSRPTQQCDPWNHRHEPKSPEECNHYSRCINGRLVYEQCPYGTEWNVEDQKCTFPEDARCKENLMGEGGGGGGGGNDEERCEEGKYYESPQCDQYYVCLQGSKRPQNCPPGLHWNQNNQNCDWPYNSRCDRKKIKKDPNKIKQQNKHPLRDISCTDGSFHPSDEDCSIYFVCVHGKKVQFRCQSSLHWDNLNKNCNWPSLAKCQVNNLNENPHVSSTTPMMTTSTSTSSTVNWWETSTSTTSRYTTTTMRATTRAPHQTTSASTTKWTTTSPSWPSTSPNPTIPSQTQTPNKGDFMIVCYFTNWAWYRPGHGKYVPADINPDLCTHIVYGFAVLGYDTLQIQPHDSWADIDNQFYGKVTALKSQGKKVTIAIGGWNDSAGDKYSRLINNPSARRKFIQNVIGFIQKYNFDGLDLDFEYPKCWQTDCSKGPASDKENFAHFVKELKEAFEPYGFLLSSAVSPSKKIIDEGYAVSTLNKYFDWIAVMCYDYHGQWDKKTGHVAPLYFHEEDDIYYFNSNYSINYWIQMGADRKKLVMGMPLYGQSFTLINPSENGLNAPASAGGLEGQFTRSSGFLSYYEICHKVQNEGWTVVHDPTGAMGPYAYKGNQWVSFDDVDMIKRKSQFVKDLGLGGAMVWALDLDDFRNTCGQGNYPLLSTIKNVLEKGSSSSSSSSSSSINKHRTTTTTTKRPSHLNPNFKAKGSGNENKQIKSPNPSGSRMERCNDQTQPYKPHESDCNLYYRCLFGKFVVQNCPAGTYWNRDHCDWECGTGNESKPPTGQLTTTTDSYHPTEHYTSSKKPHTQSTTWSWSTTTTPRPEMATLPHIEVTTMSWDSRNRTTTQSPTTDSYTSTENTFCKNNWCPTGKPITTTYNPVKYPQNKDQYKVLCYFTNWAWYREGKGKYMPQDINYNLCTHLVYGFSVLDPNNLVIKFHDKWADIDNKFFERFVWLRNKGIHVVLALGGWNDSKDDKYSKLFANPAARRNFIEHAIYFLEKYGFQGLDLDFEYPACHQVDCDKGPASDKEYFAIFVKELKLAFEPRGLTLSSAVSPSYKVVDAGYDVPTINKYLDWIAVMTYDYFGQWDKKTGHVSPFYHHPEVDNPYFNTNFSINYWISKGADRQKILLGMPTYGQSFSLVEGNCRGLNCKAYGGGEAGEYTKSRGFLSYYEICTRIESRGWQTVYDENGAMGPYAYKGNQWVSYDNVDIIRRKSQYIKDMGLGGGFIWALDLDDFRGVCNCEEHPLLKTINRVLRQYPERDPKCSTLLI